MVLVYRTDKSSIAAVRLRSEAALVATSHRAAYVLALGASEYEHEQLLYQGPCSGPREHHVLESVISMPTIL